MLKLTWLVSAALFSSLVSGAETKMPCLIFSGNAETEHNIDLSKLNRITFGDNSMVISSSDDDTQEPIELLYSLYHHFEVGDAEPTNVGTGIDTVDADSNSRIFFDSQSQLLHLQTSSDSEFSVGIFDINGHLLLTSDLCDGDSLTLEALASGVYVAVATDEKIKLNLKFIKN